MAKKDIYAQDEINSKCWQKLFYTLNAQKMNFTLFTTKVVFFNLDLYVLFVG